MTTGRINQVGIATERVQCHAAEQQVESTAQWHDQQKSPRNLQQHMADAVSRSFQCDIGVVLPKSIEH
jgi:hypothetical protein